MNPTIMARRATQSRQNFAFYAAIGVIYIYVEMGCQHSAPVTQVTDDRLAHIMADIATADAAVALMSGFERDSTAKVYYKQVFLRNGVTQEDYEAALRIAVKDVQRIEQISKQAEALLQAQK
jgi:Domain of unknown function (DUF4296)